MKIVTDIAKVETHRRIASGIIEPAPDLVRAVLRSDWDIWPIANRTEPTGIARIPHIAILQGTDLVANEMRPVLALDMECTALQAGLWRQMRILPFLQAMPDTKAPEAQASDPYLPDARLARDGGRAWFLRRIFGHDIQDAVLYLLDVRDRDWKLFTLLLAKDFKAAFAYCPDLFDDPWPASARARWRVTRTRDRLPPVLMLVLLAELARLSCNHHGLLAISFGADGREIFNRPFLKAMEKMGNAETGTPRPWLATIADMAPLQSTALLPPDMVFEERKAELGRAWSESAAAVLTSGIAIYGQPLLETITRPQNAEVGAKLHATIASHPRFQSESREGYGAALQKGHPASYWAMHWRLHGVVGLIELAQQARTWNAQHRTGKDRFRPWSADKTDRPLERAIVAMSYCWVETFDARALATALEPVIQAKGSYGRRKAAEFGRDTASSIDMDLSLDALADGANFGRTICIEARARLPQLPGPGEEGYTARYRAHLWFDFRGDDISHYQRHQRKAIKRHQALLRNGNALDRAMQRRLSGEHRNLLATPSPYRAMRNLPVLRAHPHAARAAQDYAMMISPPSADPIRLVNLQPWRWRVNPE